MPSTQQLRRQESFKGITKIVSKLLHPRSTFLVHLFHCSAQIFEPRSRRIIFAAYISAKVLRVSH